MFNPNEFANGIHRNINIAAPTINGYLIRVHNMKMKFNFSILVHSFNFIAQSL